MINLTTWNCRGLSNALPYLNHLTDEGSDIIVVSEHWLWPFNLNQLQDIPPHYTGFRFANSTPSLLQL